MRSLHHVLAGVGLGIGVAMFLACAPDGRYVKGTGSPDPVRAAKMQEILQRWGNIQNWRHDADMTVDPANADVISVRRLSPKEVRRRVCENGHEVPKSCTDVCGIADDICDNAERICILADELGKDDVLAQDKCASSKASCREAQAKCCNCSTAAVQAPAPDPAAGGPQP